MTADEKVQAALDWIANDWEFRAGVARKQAAERRSVCDVRAAEIHENTAAMYEGCAYDMRRMLKS